MTPRQRSAVQGADSDRAERRLDGVDLGAEPDPCARLDRGVGQDPGDLAKAFARVAVLRTRGPVAPARAPGDVSADDPPGRRGVEPVTRLVPELVRVGLVDRVVDPPADARRHRVGVVRPAAPVQPHAPRVPRHGGEHRVRQQPAQVRGRPLQRYPAVCHAHPCGAAPGLQVRAEQLLQVREHIGGEPRRQPVAAVVHRHPGQVETGRQPADVLGVVEHEDAVAAARRPGGRGETGRAGTEHQ